MFFFIWCTYRLLFDPQTPIGYAFNIILQSCSVILISNAIVCALGLLLGFFGFMMAFGQSIQQKIHNINANYSKKIDKKNEKITTELINAIRFHSDIKEFSIQLIASNYEF